jgi:glycosyltransferase involved in cell wall biosynthesis
METYMKISIAIPCYEMNNKGSDFLNFSLENIFKQTYKNIEVVVSDHSIDNNIENLVNNWKNKLNIKYIKNLYCRGSSSANLNIAMKNCTGEIIKILFQDDFLLNKESIKNTVDGFNKEGSWLVSSCLHTSDGTILYRRINPVYHDEIHLGNNTMSSPSILAVRNNNIQKFDEKLVWLMDVEYYKRLYVNFGPPIILNIVTVVNRMWNGQVSKTMVNAKLINKEVRYVRRKYDKKI